MTYVYLRQGRSLSIMRAIPWSMMGHQEVPSLIVGQRKEVYYKIIDFAYEWQFYARTMYLLGVIFNFV